MSNSLDLDATPKYSESHLFANGTTVAISTTRVTRVTTRYTLQFLLAGFSIRQSFDPNALYQSQSQAAMQYMSSGGAGQLPAGSPSSAGSKFVAG